jgi:hypothetical protein
MYSMIDDAGGTSDPLKSWRSPGVWPISCSTTPATQSSTIWMPVRPAASLGRRMRHISAALARGTRIPRVRPGSYTGS